MKPKQFLVFSILIFCSLQLKNYASQGTSAASFLAMETSVSALATGRAAVAKSGISSLFSNPASIAGVSQSEVSMQYANYLDDLSYRQIQTITTLPIGNLALQWGDVQLGTQQRTTLSDPSGQHLGAFNNGASALSCVLASKIERLKWGVGAKWIRESLDAHASTSWAAALGFQYDAFRNTTVGMALNNITIQKSKFIKKESSHPQTLRFGVTSTHKVFKRNITVLADCIKENNAYYALGLEGELSKFLSIRVGYFTQDNLAKFSSGLGLNLRLLRIDFAYQPVSDFQDTYRFGVSLKL